MRIGEAAQERFRDLVLLRLGLVVPGRLDRRLQRALGRAGEVLGESRADVVAEVLAAESWTAPAWQAAIAVLTVRETSFFRQRAWWDAVIAQGLAPLVAARRREGERRLTCHSFGCASGEETYSLAMLLDQLIGAEPGWSIDIVGFDICGLALAAAEGGVFDRHALREVDDAARARWFDACGDGRLAVKPRIRSMVRFQPFNLVEKAEAASRGEAGVPHPVPADFVICRNVLIHLEPRCQTEVARYLTERVAFGGSLVVSPVEATASWFEPLAFRATPQAILFSNLPKRIPAERRPRAEARVASPPVRPERRPAPAADLPPGDGDPRLRRARHLADIGLFEEARRLCRLTVASSPEADLLMALVCQALGDLDAAEGAALRGIEKAPGAPAAHYVHAIVCLKAGRSQTARRALRRAVALIGSGEDNSALARRLGIEVQQIRQAARRLGADGDAGGPLAAAT